MLSYDNIPQLPIHISINTIRFEIHYERRCDKIHHPQDVYLDIQIKLSTAKQLKY